MPEPLTLEQAYKRFREATDGCPLAISYDASGWCAYVAESLVLRPAMITPPGTDPDHVTTGLDMMRSVVGYFLAHGEQAAPWRPALEQLAADLGDVCA